MELIKKNHGMASLINYLTYTRWFRLNEFDAMKNMLLVQVVDELLGDNGLQCLATEILDSKYVWMDVAKVIDMLTNSNVYQKADLLQILQDNEKMWNGTLSTSIKIK